MKIVFVQTVLPFYREALFNEVKRLCEESGDHFELWVSKPSLSFDLRKTGGFLSWARYFQIRVGSFGFSWQSLPFSEAISCDVLIVPDNFRCLSNILLIAARKTVRKTVITFGHGTNFNRDKLSSFNSIIKPYLIKKADKVLVYTDYCINPLLKTGVKAEKISVTENAIDTSPAEGIDSSSSVVSEFRKTHNLTDSVCIAFLGSIYKEKRPERILALGETLIKKIPNLKFIVIGNGSADEIFRISQPPWLVFLGALKGRDKFVALSACRCMVSTDIAGLNLLDAMAVGLPLIVTNNSNHSPEIAYLKHNHNGFLVENSIEALEDACYRMCTDDNVFHNLSSNSRLTSSKCTITRMASNIYSEIKNT